MYLKYDYSHGSSESIPLLETIEKYIVNYFSSFNFGMGDEFQTVYCFNN